MSLAARTNPGRLWCLGKDVIIKLETTQVNRFLIKSVGFKLESDSSA